MWLQMRSCVSADVQRCFSEVRMRVTGYQIDERLRRRNTETSPARRGSGLDGDTSLADLSPLGTTAAAAHVCIATPHPVMAPLGGVSQCALWSPTKC